MGESRGDRIIPLQLTSSWRGCNDDGNRCRSSNDSCCSDGAQQPHSSLKYYHQIAHLVRSMISNVDVCFGSKADVTLLNFDVCFAPKADMAVRFVPIGDVVIPSRGEYSATMRRRRHTNNWPEAACVDRPERLDWFREQRDPRTLRSAAPLRLPKHLSRGR